MENVRNRKVQKEKRVRFWSTFYAAIIYAMFYIPVLVMMPNETIPGKVLLPSGTESCLPSGTTISGKRWSIHSLSQSWQR